MSLTFDWICIDTNAQQYTLHNPMVGKLHVLGNNGEALIVGRVAPGEADIELLTQEFALKIQVLTTVTPNDMMQNVLQDLDAYKAAGDEMISSPKKELHSLFISFNNGWSAYCSSSHQPDKAEPRPYQELIKEWWEGDRDPRMIAGYPLSQITADKLELALIGIPPPALQGGVTAIDRFNVHEWEMAIKEAFKDGWNAARQSIRTSN